MLFRSIPVFPLLPFFPCRDQAGSSALLSLQIRSSWFCLFAPLVPRESITATDPDIFPNPGGILSFQNRLTLTRSSSSTSLTVSLTSTSTLSQTHFILDCRTCYCFIHPTPRFRTRIVHTSHGIRHDFLKTNGHPFTDLRLCPPSRYFS